MSDALVIFARYPRLGRVKTRLQAELAPQDCLRLHRAFLQDTIKRTASLGFKRYLYLAGCSTEEAEALAVRENWVEVVIRLQHGNDLGRRMQNAFQEVQPAHRRVAFLGSDTPTLPLERLSLAFERLDSSAVVIVPADDGGYCLLGLSAPRPAIFQGIDWGGPQVLEQTLARLESDDFCLLPAWYDIDLPADLRRLAKELEGPVEGYPENSKTVLDEIL